MTKIALSATLSIVVGFFLGALYDVVRFFRVLFNISVENPFGKKGVRPYIVWIFASIGDLLFLLAAAVCMCVFFFLTGDGRMRSYGLCGAFLGFEVYYHTVGKLFIGIVDFLAKRVKKAVSFICGKVLLAAGKIIAAFLKMPIVRRIANWYNEYKIRRKRMAEMKKRRKRMAKNGCIKNGF